MNGIAFNRWPRAPIGARLTIVVQCNPIGAAGRVPSAARLRHWSLAPQKAASCDGEDGDLDRRCT